MRVRLRERESDAAAAKNWAQKPPHCSGSVHSIVVNMGEGSRLRGRRVLLGKKSQDAIWTEVWRGYCAPRLVLVYLQRCDSVVLIDGVRGDSTFWWGSGLSADGY